MIKEFLTIKVSGCFSSVSLKPDILHRTGRIDPDSEISECYIQQTAITCPWSDSRPVVFTVRIPGLSFPVVLSQLTSAANSSSSFHLQNPALFLQYSQATTQQQTHPSRWLPHSHFCPLRSTRTSRSCCIRRAFRCGSSPSIISGTLGLSHTQ